MKTLPLLALPLLLTLGDASASTLRCEKGIISEGDRTSEVIAKCGKPNDRSFVGYASGGDLPVEEWVYGPRSGGMIYFLRFEGGRLKNIDSKRGN
ncbi:DUF2845 domain-containing protein [Zestomonas carbonaria]|uniref:DUF2845 domain-containing protein n=1 Tax=Zestomonas carbonaria TaxID=2762745 RepID=A0A7U7EN22_9GAMM|nr:DUF2845 domain-containing protein [Pseudomonas carbonaria]CAD5107896.1 hypothetical protein PSEWESI4_02176 [Pseudomonas carbonaria]